MPMDGRLYRAAQIGDMKVLREYKDQLTTHLTLNKNTVLHIAAFGALTHFSFLAIVSPDLLFCLNSDGDTCIHVAARSSQFNLIEALIGYMKQNCPAGLEAGIDSAPELLRIQNNKGNTALHEAVMYRSHQVVELLVKEDPDFTHPPNNASKSPLFLAMEKKDRVSAELILSNSSLPSYAGPYGTTALHAAAIYHLKECVKMILDKEPSLMKQVDDKGWSPLHFAAFFGSKSIVRALLMEDKQMAYGTIAEDNKTPLHLAALNDMLPAVKEIIEYCPDSAEAVTSHGYNAFHLARLNACYRVKAFTRPHKFLHVDRSEILCNSSIDIHHPYLEETDLQWRGKNVKKNEITKDKESWKERVNTHLVVAALITTISFAAGFTIPGGFESGEHDEKDCAKLDDIDKGMAVLAKKAAFKAFVVANTIAMILSTTALFLHFVASLKRDQMTYHRYLKASACIIYAMVAMLVAFTTGLYVVLPVKDLAITICVMCSVSLVLVYCIATLDIGRYVDRRLHKL